MAKISSAEKIAKLEMQLAEKKAKCEKLQQEIKQIHKSLRLLLNILILTLLKRLRTRLLKYLVQTQRNY